LKVFEGKEETTEKVFRTFTSKPRPKSGLDSLMCVILKEVQIKFIRKMLAKAADAEHSN